jgi:hypothetical protein
VFQKNFYSFSSEQLNKFLPFICFEKQKKRLQNMYENWVNHIKDQQKINKTSYNSEYLKNHRKIKFLTAQPKVTNKTEIYIYIYIWIFFIIIYIWFFSPL